MERTKVLLLAVIAAALCVLAARELMPVAHADPGTVRCQSWYSDTVRGGNQDKLIEQSMQNVAPVREWLTANPGQPVFRSTRAHGDSNVTFGYIDTLCVR